MELNIVDGFKYIYANVIRMKYIVPSLAVGASSAGSSVLLTWPQEYNTRDSHC